MGAGTSPADGTRSDGTHADEPAESAGTTVTGKPGETGAPVTADGPGPREAAGPDGPVPDEAAPDGGASAEAGPDEAAGPDGSTADEPATAGEGGGSTRAPSRRFSLTRDTARPEGGGRAASGDAPAPARQWPLLTVLCTAGAGLLIVALDPFAEAFRIGAMLIGAALLAGAVLRWVVPSVGMLAVRSRFTDLVTYGLMGGLIVLLALMAQPKPWLDVPFLQNVVHFTIR
ncbi:MULTISPECIES: DUF3017 domain-containing protein [unclassified Streptomyces]|nr:MULTISPECIES: DUF3017 domain-containing protein [unclassified Streptomyces]AEN11922.1 conserved hypothetical protein [Streptomyces sp. SirexAA-E]MYR66403.1 DUF3017 domain-containing protein [Streptomyces sp. SID4939]MYS03433.1 DUF3017 domain-containing protein [Streptomyces sp. SID4940]MYT65201.1 DUF3017 domain-containing protein [Streptomyces sp. SID8357]MYT84923.1 DUF3017 domain-containing protein [Streptomyces sp. SID8360]